jgi:hypothetical protein
MSRLPPVADLAYRDDVDTKNESAGDSDDEPVAGRRREHLRALSAIQARGFRAATEVVDRFVRVTGRGFGAPSQPHADEAAEAGLNGFPDVGRLVKSFQDAIAQLSDSAARPALRPVLDLAHPTASGEALLEATEPGPVATEVWLHNRGPEDLGKVRLRCSDLLSHDGAVIDSAAIGFQPDVVPMPGRSSRGVTVEVDVPANLSPGRYRGTLLADGHADVWMPVALNIKPRTK